MSGRVGIEKIAAYPCSLALDMVDLARARGVDPSHPLNDLWVTSRSLNPPWEDPVTMAVNAALALLTDEDRAAIELIAVGTESSPDFGKPISSYVQRHCGIGPNCRNFEVKHACYGGTGALMMAAHWVAARTSPGKKALVVTTDQSRSHIGQPWEFVLGAAAVAMLVSDQPDVLELDLEHNGYWTHEIADTYRPTSSAEVGHADTSLFGYLEAVEGAFDHYCEKVGPFDYRATFAKHIYHVPFGAMTYRAHRALLRRAGVTRAADTRLDFESKCKPALRYNARFGGTYTSATFIALMGLLDSSPDLRPGDRVSIFAYGSGSCAEFYSTRIGPHAHQRVAAASLGAGLDARRMLSVAEYEQIEKARADAIDRPDYVPNRQLPGGLFEQVYAGSGRLVLTDIEGFQRNYERA